MTVSQPTSENIMIDFDFTDDRTELDKALGEFSDHIVISQDDIDSLSLKYRITTYRVEMIAIDCSENISDMLLDLLNEYKGDGVKANKWFNSYVEDIVADDSLTN